MHASCTEKLKYITDSNDNPHNRFLIIATIHGNGIIDRSRGILKKLFEINDLWGSKACVKSTLLKGSTIIIMNQSRLKDP